MSDAADDDFEYDQEDDDLKQIPIINVFSSIPLFDLYLLQAMNIAIPDEFIIEQEGHLLQMYLEIERAPMDEAWSSPTAGDL